MSNWLQTLTCESDLKLVQRKGRKWKTKSEKVKEDKFIWNEEKFAEFKEAIGEESVSELLNQAIGDKDGNINEALQSDLTLNLLYYIDPGIHSDRNLNYVNFLTFFFNCVNLLCGRMVGGGGLIVVGWCKFFFLMLHRLI